MDNRLLVKNIDVLVTMDQKRSVYESAWLLAENGRIHSIGSGSDQLPQASDVIDGSGRIVMPGLVNTHHHLFQTLLRAVPSFQNAELFPWLRDLYLLMGSLTDEMVYTSSMLGLSELLMSGCTTAQDHFYLAVNNTSFDTEIRAARELGIRFHLSRGSFSVGQSDGGLPPDEIVEDEDDVLADCERLFETYHEGEPGGMIRIDLAPCSPFSVSPRLMEESAVLARRLGALLHTHLAETSDEEAYCLETYGHRPVEYVADLGWTGPDTWYAHAVHLDNEELALMGETGTGAAHCPSSNARLGSGIARLSDMLTAGVRVGLGVDGSASNDSSHLLAEARMAMLFQRAVHGADAFTATQALELATLGGASVLRREDIGALEPGKAADLVGFDLGQIDFAGALHDPVAALVFCTPPRADFSVIDGRQVVRDGQPVDLDVKDLITRHNRLSSEIVSRTEARHGQSFSDRIWHRLATEVNDA